MTSKSARSRAIRPDEDMMMRKICGVFWSPSRKDWVQLTEAEIAVRANITQKELHPYLCLAIFGGEIAHYPYSGVSSAARYDLSIIGKRLVVRSVTGMDAEALRQKVGSSSDRSNGQMGAA
ncbi:hypothetical protein RPE78_12240 [Thioclava litoralis]|uniref:Uncharacterized protein n=1 Tax=Thioclava litoralis TaxID=3076557 RepID=A0ABZ1E0T6_9RHOB|nr:hypothetical protein RPE78_12240 [Thioclava sp. FTW29]